MQKHLNEPLLADDQPLLYPQKQPEPVLYHHPFARGLIYFGALAFCGIFLYFLIFAASNSYNYVADPPYAGTVCGNVQGVFDDVNEDLGIFRGIPYALPPNGKRRWQPAKNVSLNDCWKELIYDATKQGPSCWQSPGSSLSQSEDCLTLDIYTTNFGETTLFQTIVWLHGGGNVDGSSASYSNLVNWARNDDICLVAVNYRLNVFGFLALDILSQNDSRGVSGNYGITDIQVALEWLRDNLNGFGCNNRAITLMGHSSGATNIFALLSSPASQGLFQKAIAMSGSPNISMSLSQAEAQNQVFLSNIGCSDLTCLLDKTPEALVASVPVTWWNQSFWPTDPSGLNQAGLVIVDGVTVQFPFLTAVSNGLIDVPLFIQVARDELEVEKGDPLDSQVIAMNSSEYRSYLQTNFQAWGSDVGDRLATQYQNVTDDSVERSFYDLQTDIGLYCAYIQVGIAAASKFKSKIYLSFVWQPPTKPVFINSALSVTDPFHGWDYMVATNAWDYLSSSPVYVPMPADLQLGESIHDQFIQFATSTPTSPLPINSVPGFPQNFSVGVQGYDDKPGVTDRPNFRADYCEILADVGLNPDSRFWWVN